MKVIVTGGAGFIGSHIVDALVNLGHQVKVIDNLSTGRLFNLEAVMNQIDFVKGNVCDLDLLKREFVDFDYVLHQAGIGSVAQSIADPTAVHQNNTVGTLNVLVAAKDSNIKRVIYSSSCSIYGDSEEVVKSESSVPQPLSPYALGKYTGELYCRLFYQLYGLETISLRYFNVFGPRQPLNGLYAAVIPKFVTAMIEGKSPIIYGDGEQSRDFVYVDDVVAANLLALATSHGNGEIINIASGRDYTLNQLIQEINYYLNSQISPIYQAARPGDVRQSRADINKARTILGYQPNTPLGPGLGHTIAWHKSQTVLTN